MIRFRMLAVVLLFTSGCCHLGGHDDEHPSDEGEQHEMADASTEGGA